MISLEGVMVRYGRRTVVEAFSAQVGAGEWLGLIGPNGAGKSSLLKAAVGVVPFAGGIAVDGAPLAELPTRRRAQLVAYVPQEPLLPPDMTGFEYVLLGRAPYVSYFGTESPDDQAIARAALERLDLAGFAERRLGELSGGERQRLVIARALATEAPVLVLDEPTSALDIGHQQQALDLVAGLREERGITVISAMHDLTLAGMYADRLVLLHEGRTVAAGRAADVLTEPNLTAYYAVRATVRTEPDGTVVVTPRR
ncbi:MAG TPA: ABC transporter ATP-binding protein [Ilumatobacter sp.]|nr:ABC transporter ATP-binding protein [Ilumatobacter sp.]